MLAMHGLLLTGKRWQKPVQISLKYVDYSLNVTFSIVNVSQWNRYGYLLVKFKIGQQYLGWWMTMKFKVKKRKNIKLLSFIVELDWYNFTIKLTSASHMNILSNLNCGQFGLSIDILCCVSYFYIGGVPYHQPLQVIDNGSLAEPLGIAVSLLAGAFVHHASLTFQLVLILAYVVNLVACVTVFWYWCF